MLKEFYKYTVTQFKEFKLTLLVNYVLLSILMLAVAFVSNYFDIPVRNLTADPASIFYGNPFTGVVSYIGILLWCSTVAICFFTAVILRIKNNQISIYLFFSGLLTLLLLVDDLFMLHEKIIPDYTFISENKVYISYLTFVIVYFLKFRSIIIKTEFILLLIAGGFFALSIISDRVLPNKGMQYLMEDGFKLFGISTWLIYYVRTCYFKITLKL